MNIWIDIKNSHEPLLFRSIMRIFEEHEFQVTCRDFAEIVTLLEKYDIKHRVIGGRPEGHLVRRLMGFWWRVMQLSYRVSDYDVALSHSSVWGVYAAKLKRRKTIVFTDNDINSLLNKRMFKHVDFLITPKAIPIDKLITQGARKDAIYQFEGYKEDIYIADYVPDPDFIGKNDIPFSDFITIRAENLQAIYSNNDGVSMVPELLKRFDEKGINVILLPRHKSDNAFAIGYSNVYIPLQPLNGLDLCYHSKGILTGAGTFAREAACLGTPAVSFYPGLALAAVDYSVIKDGGMIYSREPEEIVQYILNRKKKNVDLARSKRVLQEVREIMKIIFGRIKDSRR